MAVEVRLVGKACGERRISKAGPGSQRQPRTVEPPHHQVAVWTGAEQASKLPRQLVTVQSRHLLQIRRGNGIGRVRVQIVF